MSAVTLPRELVVKLLHQAQLSDGAGLILQHGGGLRLSGIAGNTSAVELERELAAREDTVFAFYRIAAQAGPDADDLSHWSGLATLFLSVSVGIKGVLQLRGWRVQGGKPEPVELALAEDDAAQSSGVSRWR